MFQRTKVPLGILLRGAKFQGVRGPGSKRARKRIGPGAKRL